MTAKNPKPLTRPRKDDPNYNKFCAQPGSLPVSDLPMQPSLKEQMQQSETMATGNSGGNVTKIERGAFLDPAGTVTIGSPIQPSFDHKACVLCDHVIVQKILGNKCKLSGALCCYMRSCPEEDRKKREAVKVLQ